MVSNFKNSIFITFMTSKQSRYLNLVKTTHSSARAFLNKSTPNINQNQQFADNVVEGSQMCESNCCDKIQNWKNQQFKKSKVNNQQSVKRRNSFKLGKSANQSNRVQSIILNSGSQDYHHSKNDANDSQTVLQPLASRLNKTINDQNTSSMINQPKEKELQKIHEDYESKIKDLNRRNFNLEAQLRQYNYQEEKEQDFTMVRQELQFRREQEHHILQHLKNYQETTQQLRNKIQKLESIIQRYQNTDVIQEQSQRIIEYEPQKINLSPIRKKTKKSYRQNQNKSPQYMKPSLIKTNENQHNKFFRHKSVGEQPIISGAHRQQESHKNQNLTISILEADTHYSPNTKKFYSTGNNDKRQSSVSCFNSQASINTSKCASGSVTKQNHPLTPKSKISIKLQLANMLPSLPAEEKIFI